MDGGVISFSGIPIVGGRFIVLSNLTAWFNGEYINVRGFCVSDLNPCNGVDELIIRSCIFPQRKRCCQFRFANDRGSLSIGQSLYQKRNFFLILSCLRG